MQNPIFIIALLLVLLLPALASSYVLSRALPGWWLRRRVRWLVWAFPVLGFSLIALIVISPLAGFDPVQTPLATLLFATLLGQVFGMVGLPVAAVLLRKQDTTEVDTRRRRFLQGAAAVVPLVGAGVGLGGAARTLAGARVFVLPLEINWLPPALEGTRILHLTDLHLGGFMTLDSLARTLERARRLEPDLVVVTGDIADDLSLLPAAMAMIHELGAPMGAYATLGNHEYGNGVDRFRNIMAGTPVDLLINFGLPVDRGDAAIFLAGVDDLLGRAPWQTKREYREESVNAAMAHFEPGLFPILLSHRPEVFDVAAERGIPLTLAGHTHGGQVGLLGHSILEFNASYRYPWGLYEKGKRKLYTSSGAGQWIPFRLGCPAEAPVLELHRRRPNPDPQV